MFEALWRFSMTDSQSARGLAHSKNASVVRSLARSAKHFVVLGLAALVLAGASACAADWPRFLGPNNDSSSAETKLLHQWPKEGPRKLWEYEKGDGHTGPAIAGGKVVLFHALDGDEDVDCLDAASGKRLWRVSYSADYQSQYGAGPGPRTSPVIDAGVVYTLGIKGTLQALDLATGAVKWKKELANDYRLLPTFFGQGGTPLVMGDKLIVPLGTEDQKSVVALDKQTGREVWAAKYPWGSSYSSPVPAQFYGRECVLAFQGGMADPPTGGLLVIDAANGQVLSATPHRARMFASVSISAPVISGNDVFVAEAYTEGGACVEIAPDFTAKVAWRARKFDTYVTSAVAFQGHFYGFAGQHPQNADLVCYEAASGRELWRDDLGSKYQRGSLLRADGAFLALGENGDLAWLDLTPKGAKITAAAKLFNAPESWTPPALSDGRLFICQNQPGSQNSKPRLICYDLRGQ
ncbi:Pyrrolo-quinoline quinone [Chthoniobacter flavus Ellin428]|uniref:Pyrrolo-quinoline quinone n=2 Tax=Chthoniobacter flavus TaxID=191863 RepID=B4D7N4_9BACT|nr:Pyrrolo-quinoline quinone [Chthoniobacter flavus Ellin428]